MSANDQIDLIFNELKMNKTKSDLLEFQALKVAFDSFVGVNSFVLSFDNEGDDEGGSYKTLHVDKINNHNIYFNPNFIEDELQDNNFFTGDLKQILFEFKMKQSDLEKEIELLSNVISFLSDNILNYIFDKNINIDFVNDQISSLEEQLLFIFLSFKEN